MPAGHGDVAQRLPVQPIRLNTPAPDANHWLTLTSNRGMNRTCHSRLHEITRTGDAQLRKRRSIAEMREHVSAVAMVRGRRWYANRLLRFQQFPDRRSANQALLRTSRKLIAESRERIVSGKNIIAFSRVCLYIN